jgi:nitrite reductase/ring-hydroxylating ferredoxin subunit
MQQEHSPIAPNRWIGVANSSDLPQEGAIERTVEGQLIAIFRHQGELYAIEGLCAHHGGPLSQGQVHAGCVTCPWHGWQYRLSDGTQLTSGVPLLRSYPVREQEHQIEIGLS